MRAWLDSPNYTWFQRLMLIVEVVVAAGHHVHGHPTPAGLVPLSVEVDPIVGLEAGSATWPVPHRFALPGFGDELWVHDGTVRATLPLTFTAAPGGGDHTVRVRVAFQACDAATCLMPSVVQVDVPVREVALVGRSLPNAVAKA